MREGGSGGMDVGPNIPSGVSRMTPNDGGHDRGAAAIWGGRPLEFVEG